MGRRLPDEDHRQIKRWNAIRRHGAAAAEIIASPATCSAAAASDRRLS
jgi:hypothetical protein